MGCWWRKLSIPNETKFVLSLVHLPITDELALQAVGNARHRPWAANFRSAERLFP